MYTTVGHLKKRNVHAISWHMAMYWPIKQLNLSSAGTLGQKKVTVVEMFKQEPMYGLTDKNRSRCRKVVIRLI